MRKIDHFKTKTTYLEALPLSDLRGASLLEIILALAIFALLAGAIASTVLGGFEGISQGDKYLEAELWAREGLEGVRAVRDRAWNELVYATTTLATTTNSWLLTGVSTAQTHGDLSRTIAFASTTDLESKLVTSTVTFPNRMGQSSIRLASLLSNWDSRDWVQTSWSDRTSDDGNLDFSAGNIKLKSTPATWATTTLPSTQTWNDVWMLSATDGFVVGNGGNIRRWNGSNWVAVAVGLTSRNLNAIYCLSSTNCFVVGANGTIARLTGSSWSVSSTGSQTWNDVWMFSATDGFVVGNGGNIRRWNNPTANVWNAITPPTTQNINAIYCWSVSSCFAAGGSGVVVKWNGGVSAWIASVDTGNQTWNDIWLLSATDGVVVGNGGLARKINFQIIPPSHSAVLTGVAANINALNLTGGWAVGNVAGSNELILIWNGTSFTRQAISPTLPNVNLLGLHCVGGGCLAVGASNNIFRLSAGGYVLSGSLISSAFNMLDNSPVQIISWGESVPVCGACDVKFKVRTALTQEALNSTSWSNDFSNGVGAIIPASFNGNRFVQYQATLTGDGSQTPIVNSVRINYK